MAVTLKIKRRASSGNAGSPSTLKSGELAFNENTSDKLLYYGYGDDGSGNATSVIAIGGEAIPNSGLANSSVTINSNSLSLGGSLTLDTDDIGEGSSNLYHTTARARGALSATTNTGVTYTSGTGVIALASVPNSSLTNSAVTVNSNSVSLGASITLDTDDIGEGSSNLYYTDARSRAAVSATANSGLTYNSSTGAFNLASIPNTALANSSITINGVATPLGGSTTTTSVSTGLGTTVTFQGTAGEVDVATNSGTNTFTIGLPNDVNITNDLSVGNDLTVTGDLTVNGALVSLSTTEVKVEDKNIVLGDTSTPTDTTANGGGITLKGASDYTIVWLDATNSWTFNQNINVTSGGLSIGGTQVINGSRVVSNLAITGSGNTVDNVTLDGGTF
jgi:hypothetical protein|tara:strand:- start:539 stop:1711 length:1173 start_codon:yes stop_codon:yes gene_type:complete